MFIIGKSAVGYDQLRGQLEKGRYVELQLLDEIDKGVTAKDFMDIIHMCKDYSIKAVHTPLVDNENERTAVNLDELQNDRVCHRLEVSLELAGELSREQNSEVLVIVHNTGVLNEYERNTPLLARLSTSLLSYFTEYPLISLGIENVTPLFLGNGFVFKNGCFFENVELAKFLSKKTGIEQRRIGTVLDVCHSRTTQRMMLKMLDGTGIKVPDEREYFEKNKDVIKEIHLANVRGIGIPHSNHGIAYEKNERMFMLEEMRYYKEFCYNCNVTLEIREADYIKNANFERNYKMLRSVCDELDIPYEE